MGDRPVPPGGRRQLDPPVVPGRREPAGLRPRTGRAQDRIAGAPGGGADGAIAVVGDRGLPARRLDLARASCRRPARETVFIGPPGLGEEVVLVLGAGHFDGTGSARLGDPGWDRSDPASRADALAGAGLPVLRAAVWAWAPASATTPTPFDTARRGHLGGGLRRSDPSVPVIPPGRPSLLRRPTGIAGAVGAEHLPARPPARSGGLDHGVRGAAHVHEVGGAAQLGHRPACAATALALTPDLAVDLAPGSVPTRKSGGDLRRQISPAGRPGPHRPPTDAADRRRGAARVVTTITGPGFESVTGTTIGVDGGQWMVP